MPATLKDIARLSGCSFQAVSAILRDQPGTRFSPATRARVLLVAEQLGYRPNASARAMRSGRTGCIAVLRGTHPNHSSLSPHLLGGIMRELDGQDLHAAILSLDDAQLTSPEHLPKLLREVVADGVLIKYDHRIPPRLGALLAQAGIPAVWVNSRQPADCVHPDDLEAGRLATERLIRLGHRRIAYADFSYDLADATEHYSAHDRHAGYRTAMRAARLAPRLLGGRRGHPAPAARLDFCLDTLRGPERPTAVIGNSAWSTCPFWHAALRLGLRVPADLSLLTFENWRHDALGQELTQYLVPEAEMGQAAVSRLLALLAAPGVAQAPLVLPFTWVPGESVAGVNG